eukprot:1324025-Lingulodinium_polyedra.AAC.1
MRRVSKALSSSQTCRSLPKGVYVSFIARAADAVVINNLHIDQLGRRLRPLVGQLQDGSLRRALLRLELT